MNPFKGDIDPFKGDIDPFAGDINPFYGDINPFWGDINPFGGDINPFGGDINPFWGTSSPVTRIIDPAANAPAWSAVGDYWKRTGSSFKQLQNDWGNNAVASGDAKALGQLADKLKALVVAAETVWGKAVVTKTGQSVQAGFATPLFAKYGIDLSNPASLAKVNAGDRARLFLDWYDGLMAYAGADRIDHWMATAHWTPAITQQQGSGTDTVIGLLDGNADGERDIASNIVWSGGYRSNVGGHGAGVASLMVAAHDGKGVMGIAPRARVVAYNPFDESSTASWDDVKAGIVSLRGQGASIINASLGAPNWTLSPEWRDVFAAAQQNDATTFGIRTGAIMQTTSVSLSRSSLTQVTTTSAISIDKATRIEGPTAPVYVIAAGNAGFTQTKNIAWDFSVDPAFLVVGSVDATGTISTFSNRPGTACLLKNGACTGDRLMNHFVVAPGELIMVSDGNGGVVRRTGTSFAAPIVSGAIALLHDRWPWLVRFPKETASIIIDTARDLGEKGVDPVYGAGLIDITRSQSPVNFNALTFYEVRQGVTTETSAPALLATGINSTWEADGVYFTLYEKVGETFRDFQVPMSSKLAGWVRNSSGNREQFQRFITGQFSDWLLGKGGPGKGFADIAESRSQLANGMSVTVAGSLPHYEWGSSRLTAHSAVTVTAPDARFGFTAGSGFGAATIGGQVGFARSTDYAAVGGGVNPLLGLASGGTFMQGAMRLGTGSVALGMTQHRFDLATSRLFTDAERAQLRGFGDYRAKAVNLHLAQPLGRRVDLSLDLSQVRESDALLGVMSTSRSDFGGGATTHVIAAAAAFDLGRGFSLALSATQGRTTSDQGQMLTTRGGVRSSAYALALQQDGFALRGDSLRVTLSQPLHVERGTLQLASVDVTDRLAGTVDLAEHRFTVGGERRPYVAELLYAAPIAQGRGEVALFGRGDLQAAADEAQGFTVGGHAKLRF